MKFSDVVLIGAGPAGTSAAIFLARQGLSVTIIDQARFPRDKVCGEFISPAADPILADLGILNDLQKLSPQRLKGVYISAYGKEELHIDYPPMPGGSESPTSLSIPRKTLDNLMLDKVRDAGVQVLEEHRVDDFIFEGDRVVGVQGKDPEGKRYKFRAKVTVDAGGRNAISLRRMSLKRPAPGGRAALAAHWRGAFKLENYCYMHISSPGYTGIAKTGREHVNVVLIVDPKILKDCHPENFYREMVLKNPLRAELLKGAEPMERVRVVESLAFDTKLPSCGGLVLAGDAMGFIDPFTGEGIYLALRSARIASDVVLEALSEGDVSGRKLMEYADRRKREFDGKFFLSRTLQKFLYHPFLCRKAVRLLSLNPGLASDLVGVIGDYLEPETVVSFSYLRRLLTASILLKSGQRRQGRMV